VVIAARLMWMLSGPATAKLFGRASGAPVWRERVVVAWAGMRGGLSLAIPLQLADGKPFPDRDLVIMVAAASACSHRHTTKTCAVAAPVGCAPVRHHGLISPAATSTTEQVLGTTL
jgi:NhaP-type Na+/H+ or K+/H+ antiporter